MGQRELILAEREPGEHVLQPEGANAVRQAFARVLQNINDCAYITDTSNSIIFANKAFQCLYGYSAHEIKGKSIFLVQLPEDPHHLPSEHNLSQNDGDEWQGEVLSRKRDGTEFTFCLSTVKIRDAHNVPCAVIGVGNAKYPERLFAESERLYRMISDAVMVVNSEGIVETMNEPAAAMSTEWSRGPTHGIHLTRLFAPQFALSRLEAITHAIRSKSRVQTEESLSLANKRHWFTTTINPLVNSDGTCSQSVVVSRDVSNEKDREESLRFFSKSVLRTQEVERKRVARELHDGLAQRLAVLRMDISFLEQRAMTDEAEAHARCRSVTATIAGLIEETRRIAMNLSPAILEDIGLTAAIRRLALECSSRQNAHVTLNLIDLDGYFGQEEEIHVYRILQEIFMNVFHHSHARNVLLSTIQTADDITFVVSDDGSGFDVELALSLHSASRHLGLRGLRERARLLSGEIEFRSAVGQGTLITLRVPRRRDATNGVEEQLHAFEHFIHT